MPLPRAGAPEVLEGVPAEGDCCQRNGPEGEENFGSCRIPLAGGGGSDYAPQDLHRHLRLKLQRLARHLLPGAAGKGEDAGVHACEFPFTEVNFLSIHPAVRVVEGRNWPSRDQPRKAVDGVVREGYRLYAEKKEQEGCRIRPGVWKHLKKRFTLEMRSVEDAERVFSGTQGLFNWCQDLEAELHNAGLKDPAFYQLRGSRTARSSASCKRAWRA